MSVKLMGLVWDLALSHAQQSVALAMADHGHHDGGSIYPALSLVAYKTGYSTRQVRRIVRELEDLGLLVKVSDGGGERPTEYRMVPDAVPAKPPYTPDKLTGGQIVRPGQVETPPRTSETPTPDIAVSAEPSIEPSGNQADPDGSAVAAGATTLEVARLCQLMSSEVRLAHGVPASSKEARVAKGWPAKCRQLLADGYTPQQIEYAIRWVCRHHYWSRRVKSMTRLASEMPMIARELSEQRARSQHLRPAGDPLAGRSREARERIARNARRLGLGVEEYLQHLQTNPNGGSNGSHHRNGSGAIAAAGSPQPALSERATA